MSQLADATTTSLWLDRLHIDHRDPLPGDEEADVAIVGGGFSGLWTAYYLRRIDPGLRVVVLEKDFCGFGASGRNGGWAVGELAGSFQQYARRSSEADALRQMRLVFDAVDEIGRVIAAEGIDADYAKGGTIYLARNTPQERRMREEITHARAQGLTEEEIRLVDADEARRLVNATNVRAGIFFAACAAIDPAKLVRGLADVVERSGATIYEQTAVAGIDDGAVRTDRGVVTAPVVVRATEAYTRDLSGERRTLLPVYSRMIATEPLPTDVLAEIGLAERPTFGDTRHMVIYGQRTADDRIAFGAAGLPYQYASRITREAELHEASHRHVHEVLVELLPALADARITHRWGGVLGIPRNWTPGLDFDPDTGRGWLGGYVGEGVAPSNLAGRTLAELITRQHTERTSAPWVGARARAWEPEPLRWLGVRASRAILRRADDHEFRTDRESSLSFRLSRLLRGAWS
jgi:glycine/D-amino acid oxidase-like deaminating enzyme